MKKDLYTLLKTQEETLAPKAELLARVFENFEKQKVSIIKRQKLSWQIASMVFLIITVLTGWHMVSAIITSNSLAYLSILFTDTNIALSMWKEISISIVETLPIIGIGLFLASIYLLFWTTKKYSSRSHTLAY